MWNFQLIEQGSDKINKILSSYFEVFPHLYDRDKLNGLGNCLSRQTVTEFIKPNVSINQL